MTAPRRAANRLVRNLTTPPAGTPSGPLVVAEVLTVQQGAAVDGNPLVTVQWRLGTAKASYLSSYTPVVGHTVQCLYNGAQLVIQGRIIGAPPEV